VNEPKRSNPFETFNPFETGRVGKAWEDNPFAPPEPWRPAYEAWKQAYVAAAEMFRIYAPPLDPSIQKPWSDLIQTGTFKGMVQEALRFLSPALPEHAAELAYSAATLAWSEMSRIRLLHEDLGLPEQEDDCLHDSADDLTELPADFMPTVSEEPARPLGEAVELALARAREQCKRTDPPELLRMFNNDLKELALTRGRQVAFSVLWPILPRGSVSYMATGLAAAAWDAHQKDVSRPCEPDER
jgi:hypothetical protein